ncbi:MAG: hypothetical protein AAF250_10480 [Pseudomonadota bacterium]
MNTPALAILAVLPMITGPLPAEEKSLVATLCGGGTITIPLGDNDEPKRDCHPKACHAANCRKQFDLEQRRAQA